MSARSMASVVFISSPLSIPTRSGLPPSPTPTKTPITAADFLNDRVLPGFAEQGMSVLRILTDRGTEYYGRADTHDFQLYLPMDDIEHTRTKVRHPC